MKIRIEADSVVIEVEADHDPAFMGSAAVSLSQVAINLFKAAIEKRDAGESDE